MVNNRECMDRIRDTLKAGKHYTTFKIRTDFLNTKHHTLTDFINGDIGKLGIKHYVSEDHTLPDFDHAEMCAFVARRRMTNENICSKIG